MHVFHSVLHFMSNIVTSPQKAKISAASSGKSPRRKRGSFQRQTSILEKISIFIARVRTQPIYVPSTYSIAVDRGEDELKEKEKKEFQLGQLQKLFLLLDDPLSCSLAVLYQIFMFIVIVLSCIVYVVSTLPSLMHQPSDCAHPACDNDPALCPNEVVCEPQPSASLESLEIFCLVIFTIDYLSRMLLSPLMPARLSRTLPPNFDTVTNASGQMPDPEYSWYENMTRYGVKYLNIIDILAIVPAYIALGVNRGPSVSIVRILRLARIFRVFKIGGMNTGVPLFSRTVKRALPAVSIMFFFSSLAVLVFGSVMYYLESGSYEVTGSFPEGSYVRWNSLRSEKEESPFRSILHSCYWAVVTTTTVGYGDFVPTSPFGRTFAVMFMYLGIILLALPISVVGASFQREYERLYPQNDNEDEDEDDGCSTEMSRVGLSSTERDDIKKSLADLNEKVLFLTDTILQMQKDMNSARSNAY